MFGEMGADGNPSYLRDWFRCLRCGETAKKLYRKALTVCKAKPVEITPEQFIQRSIVFLTKK